MKKVTLLFLISTFLIQKESLIATNKFEDDKTSALNAYHQSIKIRAVGTIAGLWALRGMHGHLKNQWLTYWTALCSLGAGAAAWSNISNSKTLDAKVTQELFKPYIYNNADLDPEDPSRTLPRFLSNSFESKLHGSTKTALIVGGFIAGLFFLMGKAFQTKVAVNLELKRYLNRQLIFYGITLTPRRIEELRNEFQAVATLTSHFTTGIAMAFGALCANAVPERMDDSIVNPK
jgi:hypothetical protein